MLPQIHGEFKIVTEPELRFAPSGMAVARCRIGAFKQRFDQDKKEWVDDKSCFLTMKVFGKPAENFVSSNHKSDLIVVEGELVTEEWVDGQGQKRSAEVILARSIGVSMRFRETPHSSDRQAAAPRQQSTPTGITADATSGAPQSSMEEPPF